MSERSSRLSRRLAPSRMPRRGRASGPRPARSVRPRTGRVGRLILPGILAAAAAVVIVIAIGQLGGATSSARTEREEVTAATGVVQSTITGTGSLEPVTDEDVDFQTSGTLKHVNVTEGEHVHKGQLLATLDDTTAALTLKQARATLADARTTLAGDRETLDDESDDSSDTTEEDATEFVAYSPETATTATTATTGTTPTRATTTTPSPTTTAPTQTTAGTATVTETVTAPAATSSATTPAATTAQSETTTSGAASGGESSSDSSGSSSTSGSSSSSTVTDATIDSDKLAIVEDEQTVTEDEAALRDTRLRAPVSGTIVSLESLEPGDSVSSGTSSSGSSSSTASDTSADSSDASDSSSDSTAASSSDSSSSSTTFAEIDSLRHLSMTVSFTESDISQLKVGQTATVSLDALAGVELAAKVTAVSSIGTTSDDVVSYDATLTLEQHDARVKPGMSASATVIIKQGHGVTVPSGAVTGSGALATVKELVGTQTRTRKVIVGIRGDNRDLIVSGLRSGATLVETETLPSEGSSAAATTTSSQNASSALGGRSFGGGFFGGGSGGPPSGGGAP